jgi:hypothetical protein
MRDLYLNLRIEQRTPHHWGVYTNKRHYQRLESGRWLESEVRLAEFSTRAEARKWVKNYPRPPEAGIKPGR